MLDEVISPGRVVVTAGSGPATALREGEELRFGRDQGPGHVGESDRVSRHHGTVRARSDGQWEVTSTGRHSGFTVYDHETPSVVVVPRRIGPVVVPFASASVVIDLGHDRFGLTVAAPGLPGWAGAWDSVIGRDTLADGGGTAPEWADLQRSVMGRANKPKTWFKTLVALCEPRLLNPTDLRVPTDAEIARRLGVTTGTVEKRLIGEVRAGLGFGAHTPHLRQTLACVAIYQGLVTRGDLDLLSSS